MTSSEVQHLMQIAVLERARAIAVAEDRFQERIRSLRGVKELAAIKESLEDAILLRRGDVVGRVRLALAQLPAAFVLRDLVLAVRETDIVGRSITAKSVSTSIKRLIGVEVELLAVGKGKRGSTYRKLSKSEQGPILSCEQKCG